MSKFITNIDTIVLNVDPNEVIIAMNRTWKVFARKTPSGAVLGIVLHNTSHVEIDPAPIAIRHVHWHLVGAHVSIEKLSYLGELDPKLAETISADEDFANSLIAGLRT